MDLALELSQTFDTVSFLQEYTEVRKYMGKEHEYMIICPYCPKHGFSPEFLPNINIEKGIFSCFKCHTFHWLIDIVMFYGDFTFKQAVKYMMENVDTRPVDFQEINLAFNSDEDTNSFTKLVQSLPEFPLPPGFVSLHDRQIPYTLKRRIAQDKINYYGLGFCPPGSVFYDPQSGKTHDYSDYIILPDRDHFGRVLYWVARDTTDSKFLRYKNPPASWTGIGSGSMIFNWHRAQQYSRGIIVEGVFDAMRVGPDAMCTYGTGLKGVHKLWLLRGGFKEIVLLFDNDGTVRDDYIHKQALELAPFFKVSVAKLPYGGDPDNYNRSTLRRVIDEAIPFQDDGGLSQLPTLS